MKRGTLAGAVTLVATRDRVLSLDAVGYADIKANRPMRGDTVFWIASQTKPITAAALMMLVDEGKVKLDDPVTSYLPELKDLWLVAVRGEAGWGHAHVRPGRVRHRAARREVRRGQAVVLVTAQKQVRLAPRQERGLVGPDGVTGGHRVGEKSHRQGQKNQADRQEGTRHVQARQRSRWWRLWEPD